MKRITFLGIVFSIIVLVGVSSANAVILVVDIDIKPGSFPNSVNLTSNGVVPVAILTTDAFDATTIDSQTVTFGPAALPVHEEGHQEDVDGDGDIDLVFHFYIQKIGLNCSIFEGVIIGWTFEGIPIYGNDSVNLVGCN